jgi:hypothetical protein
VGQRAHYSTPPGHAAEALTLYPRTFHPPSRRLIRDHLPTYGRIRTRDCVNSLTSNCPLWSVSSLSNSASINFIHSSLEILPLLFVSIASNSCLAVSVAAASFLSFSAFSASEVGETTPVDFSALGHGDIPCDSFG